MKTRTKTTRKILQNPNIIGGLWQDRVHREPKFISCIVLYIVEMCYDNEDDPDLIYN